MEQRIRVAAILPMKNGFAFMHRKEVKNHPVGDYYTFPGGGLEENESLQEGVKREIKEEFGIEVEVIKLLYEIANPINSKNLSRKEYFFLCKYISGEFGTGEGPEFSDNPRYADRGKYVPEIVDVKDVPNIILLPENIRKKFITDLQKFL